MRAHWFLTVLHNCIFFHGAAHRVHIRVAMATFWLTVHREGKISPERECGEGGVPPSFLISTIKNKVALYAPAERADTVPLFLLYPYMYSVGQPLLPEVPYMYLGVSTRMASQQDVLKAEPPDVNTV